MVDISSLEFLEKLKEEKNLNIIDVREPLEFYTFNVGGINIPLGKISILLDDGDLKFGPDDEILLVCQRGLRSKTAKVLMQNAGYKNVRNVLGGIIKLQKV